LKLFFEYKNEYRKALQAHIHHRVWSSCQHKLMVSDLNKRQRIEFVDLFSNVLLYYTGTSNLNVNLVLDSNTYCCGLVV